MYGKNAAEIFGQVSSLVNGLSREAVEDFFCYYAESILLADSDMNLGVLKSSNVLYDFKMIARLINIIAEINGKAYDAVKERVEVVREITEHYGTWQGLNDHLKIYFDILKEIGDANNGEYSRFGKMAFSFFEYNFYRLVRLIFEEDIFGPASHKSQN
ncbi:hypothetical protein [Chitinophaga japonensis]|uniref:Uncharacterized protein n=1 Tax=Chitinophaga japonensis TaxID=104662 RepID=A0A562T451_CHIJA|nr:hypothetical protein [Chitinophaga japonensis]TWI87790.1 hypothetical protein LX66_1861 [Chitinophaga japonensis]